MNLHPFQVTAAEAIQIQRQLLGKVVTRGKLAGVTLVAGVDVGFREGVATAGIAVLSLRNLEVRDEASATRPIEFPYVPGLLSFREIPVLLDALERIRELPDVILCDGQGIAHPRRLGLASHLGVLTGIRTVGVAKARLFGTHGQVPAAKGAWVPLRDGSETIGAVLRTQEGVKPLYVSIGHRIELDSAREIVMQCVSRFRLDCRWCPLTPDGP